MKNGAVEDPQVDVAVSLDFPESHAGMTAVARLTAKVGAQVVGDALLCVPTDASTARQGFLHMDIDTLAPNMGMVAEAFLAKVRELPICKGREVIFKYDGTLAKKLGWVKEHSSDGVLILSPMFQPA